MARSRLQDVSTTAFDEVPVFVPCDDESIFGVLTSPARSERGVAVVFVWGAAGFPSFGKNLMVARLGRRAAEAGYHALRFDYLGSGDSSGTGTFHRLDEPLVHEVVAVCRWLRDRGLRRVVFVGSCSGARIALAATSVVDGVAGLGLISPPLLDYTRDEAQRIADAIADGTTPEWSSATVRERLGAMIDDAVPLLLVYGQADQLYKEFEKARTGLLGDVLEAAGKRVAVRVLDGWVHADPTVAGQDLLVDAVGEWLAEIAGRVDARSEASV
jgi:dienelactone hydrolase